MNKFIFFAGLGTALLVAFLGRIRGNRANGLVSDGHSGNGFADDEIVAMVVSEGGGGVKNG